jgi:hypothetical protein
MQGEENAKNQVVRHRQLHDPGIQKERCVIMELDSGKFSGVLASLASLGFSSY